MILEIRNLSLLKFNRLNKYVLQDISWKINSPHEHWLILGANGAGKSCLLTMLWGKTWASSGILRIFDKQYGKEKTQAIRKAIGFYQESYLRDVLQYHSQASTKEVILSGYYGGENAPYLEVPAMAHEKLATLLETDLLQSSFLTSKFIDLSAGEKSRALLLRLFMNDPKLILLDECYNSLDLKGRHEFKQLLHNYIIDKHQIPSIHVLHRVEEIPSFISHALLLKEGKILALGKIDDVLTSTYLSELYGLKVRLEKKHGHFYCQILD